VDNALKRALARRVDEKVQKGVIALACTNILVLGSLAIALVVFKR